MAAAQGAGTAEHEAEVKFWGPGQDVLSPRGPARAHLSLVICGHVDSGKSTTTARLIFELGGLPERELAELRAEATALGKASFAFAFFMDRQRDERERGLTISCTTKEFFTENWHYTVIDAPGHRGFIKNTISGAAQADVALLMVPADGNFAAAVQRGSHRAGQPEGQTRQHARLLRLLGVRQLVVGVNKMDTGEAGPYSQARFEEVRDEVRGMLAEVGWGRDQMSGGVPVVPISGWAGDNLLSPSPAMPWWRGQDVRRANGSSVRVSTLRDALDGFVVAPDRCSGAPLRMPVSGVIRVRGVGIVVTGRVEQGSVSPPQRVAFVPTHAPPLPCEGTVFTVEMHHQPHPRAGPGDVVGVNVRDLPRGRLPRAGDVMVEAGDASLGGCERFVAQVQTLEVPRELRVGYTPVGFVRTGRSACRLEGIAWKVGPETGGRRVERPRCLRSGEVAECTFAPLQPLVVESFASCEGLGRVAFLDGDAAVMLGRVIGVAPAPAPAPGPSGAEAPLSGGGRHPPRGARPPGAQFAADPTPPRGGHVP